jgi:membrane-associated phospholipid phosphatase
MRKKHKKVILHKGHLLYGLITVALVFVLYYYVDRDSSYFFNKVRHTSLYDIFYYMQCTVNILVLTVPFVIIYLIAMLYLRRFYYFEQFLFIASASLFFATCITNVLKKIFGRYWTETFVNDNFSLVKTQTYGFDFFDGGLKHASFPSGHTTAIFALTTVLWIMYPKFRWLSVLMCAIVIAGLLGCNFHFPSDIVAGAFIGIISAFFVIHASQIYADNLEEYTKYKHKD